MKLELKHIKTYPDTLLVSWDNLIINIEGLDYSNNSVILERVNVPLEDIKLILRPLSDLTKEIKVNGRKFIPIKWIYEFNSEDSIIDEEWSPGRPARISNSQGCLMVFSGTSFIFEDNIKGRGTKFNDYKMATQLIEWHFDVFGLIEKNLAIDINTLKNETN